MFFERLENLIKEKNITKKKFLEDVGLSKNSMRNWEIRGNIPTLPVLSVISQYFGVTIDYLLGKEEKETKKEKPTTESDRLLNEALDIMKDLTPEEQKEAFRYLSYLKDSSKRQ